MPFSVQEPTWGEAPASRCETCAHYAAYIVVILIPNECFHRTRSAGNPQGMRRQKAYIFKPATQGQGRAQGESESAIGLTRMAKKSQREISPSGRGQDSIESRFRPPTRQLCA